MVLASEILLGEIMVESNWFLMCLMAVGMLLLQLSRGFCFLRFWTNVILYFGAASFVFYSDLRVFFFLVLILGRFWSYW